MNAHESAGALQHVSIYITAVTVFMGIFLLTPALIFWAQRLGAEPFFAGLIFAAYSMTKTLGNLFWGGMADKWGRRPPLIIGSFIVAIALILTAFARDPWQLLIIQLFRGLFGGAAAPIMPILVADMAPRKVLGGRMGVYVLMLNLASTIGIPLSGILFDIAAHWPFITAAAMEIITVLLVVFLVPETLNKAKKIKTEKPLRIERSLKTFTKEARVWFELLKRRGLFLANFWEFCRYFGRRAVISVAFPLFAEHVGLSATLIGSLGGIAGIVRMIGYIPFGVLSDRIGRKWLLILGPTVQGFALALNPLFSSFTSFAGIRSVEAVGGSIGSGPMRALIMDWTIRSERGKVQGLNKFWDSLGGALGSPLVGWITEVHGFAASFLYGAGVMFAVSIMVTLAWKEPPKLKTK